MRFLRAARTAPRTLLTGAALAHRTLMTRAAVPPRPALEPGDPAAAYLLAPPVPGEPLVRAALRVLHAPSADAKVAQSNAAVALWRAGQLELPSAANADADPAPPTRPADDGAVTFVHPQKIKRLKGGGTVESRCRILHSMAVVEAWAVALGWDIIARFGRAHASVLPPAFWNDFVTLADDEARHFSLLRARLRALGSDYGAFPAHDSLWSSALDTAHSLPARLAVEHATHEARGLDVLPNTIAKFERAGDAASAALLTETIYPEEITHCAAGVRWVRHLFDVARTHPDLDAEWAADARAHADAAAWFRSLVATHFRGTVRGPFNHVARAQAGFDKSWYEPLAEAWADLPKKAPREDGVAADVVA